MKKQLTLVDVKYDDLLINYYCSGFRVGLVPNAKDGGVIHLVKCNIIEGYIIYKIYNPFTGFVDHNNTIKVDLPPSDITILIPNMTPNSIYCIEPHIEKFIEDFSRWRTKYLLRKLLISSK